MPKNVAPATGLRQLLYGYTVLGIVAIALLLQTLLSGLGVRTKWARPLARALARICMRLAGISMKVSGFDRLPMGPHALLLNHSSFADAVALIAMLPARPGYAFVTRRQFRSQWLLWPLVHGLGTLVLAHPSGSYQRNVGLIRERLTKGESLVVFPEGRIPSEPDLLEFHSGVFLAAVQAGVPVVPARLSGTRAVLPLGSWLPRKGGVCLSIAPPIQAHQGWKTRGDSSAASQLRRASRDEIVRMLGTFRNAQDS